MLVRKCSRCGYDINIRYLLKEDSFNEIICPNCGRVLIATGISRFFTLSTFIMGFSIGAILPIGIVNIAILEGAWCIFSYYVLPAFFYKYEEKDSIGD